MIATSPPLSPETETLSVTSPIQSRLDILCLAKDGQLRSTFRSVQIALRELSADEKFALTAEVFDYFDVQNFINHMKARAPCVDWLIFVPCPENGRPHFLAKLIWALAVSPEKNLEETNTLAVIMSPDSPVKAGTIAYLQLFARKYGSTFRMETIS